MKYPHTPYFKFSPSVDKEDVRESGYFNINNFINKDIIFTTKMDGSNCVMTSKHIAARNGKTVDHKSFDYAKVLHSQIHALIPENHHVFGEWLYAEQKITNGHEGIVVRTKEAFKDFDNNVAKYVRRNHVQTDEHWSKQKIIRNILKS